MVLYMYNYNNPIQNVYQILSVTTDSVRGSSRALSTWQLQGDTPH